MTTVELYDVREDVRNITDECPECHGEPLSADDACPNCGGELATMLERQLTPLRQGEIRQTALQLSRRICEFEAEAKVLKAHAVAIALRGLARENTARFLKGWLQREMESAGIDKLKDEFTTVYLQDTPASIEVVDDQAVPRKYKRATLQMPLSAVPDELREYITGYDVPKTPIKELLEETGEILPGCAYHAKGDTRHLRVRS